MNKGCYHVVFNKATGVFAAVSELARRHTRSSTAGEYVGDVSAISGFFTRFSRLACVIAMLCNGINVVSAQVIADPNAQHQPTVTQAPNQVTNVQIVAPNGAGVSHNRYGTFNVGSEGVILSNNTGVANTQLGGTIVANPHLQQSGAAKVIVNEVTSANKTILKGYLEVAGQKADVVVSNPNGIHVGNFGFINAQRGVLTTGIPVFGGSGSLDAFRVEQGKITIEQGRKFNDRSTEQTDLIARSVQVNGEIWANQLNVIAGSNQVNYADLGVTVIEGKGSKPRVAIDVGVVGGMYANKINMVGSEAGVGVNTYGAMVSHVNNIQINSNGHVNVGGKIAAAHDVIISAKESIVNQHGGVLHAKGNVSLHTEADIRNTGLIVSDQEIAATAGNVRNAGRIYGDTITLTATGSIANGKQNSLHKAAGVVAAHDSLTLAAHDIANQDGGLLLTENGTLTIHGAKGAKSAANTVTNASSKIDAGSELVIATATLNNTNSHYKTREKSEHRHVVELAEGRGRPDQQRVLLGEGSIRSNGQYDQLVYTDKNGKVQKRDQFTKDDFIRTTTETVLEDSKPGELIARGDMTLSGKVTNDKSIITASGDIRGDVARLDNIDGKGERIERDAGVSRYHDIEDAAWHTKSKNKETKAGDIARVNARETIDLVLAKQTAHDTSLGQPGKHQDKDADSLLSQIESQLYQRAAPDQDYLIETDPVFTGGAKSLSGEYLMAAMGRTGQKHLGDGYYEQKMVMEQLIRLTGRRDSRQGISTEEQYKELMDAALAIQEKLGLIPGIALTQAQQQDLTQDIVWMVSKPVILPNGKATEVLSPVVYLAKQHALATPTTTGMLTASHIVIHAQDGIHNSGLVLGNNNVTLTSGKDIENLFGAIYSGDTTGQVKLDAAGNISHVSAGISGSRVDMHADKDVHISTKTSVSTDLNGTNIDLERAGEITGGKVKITAGHDLQATAAQIGAIDSVELHAAGNVALHAATTQSEARLQSETSHSNYVKTRAHGTQVRSNGDVIVHAGKDVSTEAVLLAGEGNVDVQAGGNLKIGDARETYHYDDALVKSSRHWFMNRKKTELQKASAEADSSVGSRVVGKNIRMQAGKQLTVTGSGVSATHDIELVGEDGVQIEAGKNYSTTHAETETTTSWSFWSDGSAISNKTLVGKSLRSLFGLSLLNSEKNMSAQHDTQSETHTRSLIATQKGDIHIGSKQDVVIKGGEINAGQDATIEGASVSFEAVKDTYQQSGSSRQSQSGLNFSADGLSIDLYDTAKKILDARKDYLKSEDSLDKKRMTTNIGHLISQSAGAVWKFYKDGVAGKSAGAGTNGEIAVKVLGVHVGVGKNTDKQTYSSTTTHQIGDAVSAIGNVKVIAHGNGSANTGDIRATGTHISGKKVNLEAKGNVTIESAKSETVSHQNSTSSGYSFGLGLNIGGAQNGITGEVGGHQGGGNVDQSSLQHHNASIVASDTLTVTSGQDVHLKGAALHGGKVAMKVDGDLNIESQQDTTHYLSKQKNNGINASACLWFCQGTPFVASVGPTGTEIRADYAAVKEQSGIFAGNQGFDISVTGNTDLKGAVIASEASKNDNQLKTGTFTSSQIVNKTEYQVKQENKTLTYNGDLFSSAVLNAVGWVGGNKNKGPKTKYSETNSAIADANITIADHQGQVNKTGQSSEDTVASIGHDTAHAHQKLDPNFDIEKIRKEIEISNTITQIARDVAPIIETTLGDVLTHDVMNNTATKVALHSIIDGALTKAIGGDWRSGMAAGAASTLALELFAKELKSIPGLGGDENKAKRDAIAQLMSMAIAKGTAQLAGGSASDGNAAAVIAQQAAEFNYLKHDEDALFRKEYQKCGENIECKNNVIEKATKLSEKNNQELTSSCQDSNSQECRSNMREALDYVAYMHKDEFSKELANDKKVSRVVYFDQVFQGEDGYKFYADITDRKKFFAALDKGLNDKGHEVFWFKEAMYVSREFEGMKNLSMGFLKSENEWVEKVGNFLMRNGWRDFNDIYKNPNPIKGEDAKKWDSKRLSDEQRSNQFLYDEYRSVFFNIGGIALHRIKDLNSIDQRIKAGEREMKNLRNHRFYLMESIPFEDEY